jgi:hypothetical protein
MGKKKIYLKKSEIKIKTKTKKKIKLINSY